jgi:large subunit ribosomal protein L13
MPATATAPLRRTPTHARKTFSAKNEEVKRKWWIIDAADQVLGDVAVTAADILRGKNKPIFTPHVDTGDYVIVVNAEKVRLTGKKELQKIYTSHSGYIGNQKRKTPADLRAKHPELLIEKAIKGMIPHNSLGRQIFLKLKVFKGPNHKHENHQPQPVVIA